MGPKTLLQLLTEMQLAQKEARGPPSGGWYAEEADSVDFPKEKVGDAGFEEVFEDGKIVKVRVFNERKKLY